MGKKSSGTRTALSTGVHGGVHDLGSKAQRNVELLSALGSFFASEMDDGDRIGMTRLAKSLPRADGGYPHVNTVREKCTELSVVQDFIHAIKFHFKNGQLIAVEKIGLTDRELSKITARLSRIEQMLTRIEAQIGSNDNAGGSG